MATQDEVQIWTTLPLPIYRFYNALNKKPFESRLQVEVFPPKQPIPEELEVVVMECWKKAEEKNPKLFDGEMIYLAERPYFTRYVEETISEERLIIPVNVRGFRYTQAFWRTPDLHGQYTEEKARYKLSPLSTNALMLTADEKILMATKINQYNEIANFGGFPSVKDVEEYRGRKLLQLPQAVKRRLQPEIGNLIDDVTFIEVMGITYAKTPTIGGADLDVIINLLDSAENARKRFSASEQFSRETFLINFNPTDVAEFIRKTQHSGKTIGRFDLGCLYLAIAHYFGEKEAKKVGAVIMEQGINFSPQNTTSYFE